MIGYLLAAFVLVVIGASFVLAIVLNNILIALPVMFLGLAGALFSLAHEINRGLRK